MEFNIYLISKISKFINTGTYCVIFKYMLYQLVSLLQSIKDFQMMPKRTPGLNTCVNILIIRAQPNTRVENK